jgi:hypothetical protein
MGVPVNNLGLHVQKKVWFLWGVVVENEYVLDCSTDCLRS